MKSSEIIIALSMLLPLAGTIRLIWQLLFYILHERQKDDYFMKMDYQWYTASSILSVLSKIGRSIFYLAGIIFIIYSAYLVSQENIVDMTKEEIYSVSAAIGTGLILWFTMTFLRSLSHLFKSMVLLCMITDQMIIRRKHMTEDLKFRYLCHRYFNDWDVKVPFTEYRKDLIHQMEETVERAIQKGETIHIDKETADVLTISMLRLDEKKLLPLLENSHRHYYASPMNAFLLKLKGQMYRLSKEGRPMFLNQKKVHYMPIIVHGRNEELFSYGITKI